MPTPLPAVHLARGREKKIRANYPWVQREEVVQADKTEMGALAQLIDFEGNFLAIGFHNWMSRFPFRVLTLENEWIDVEFFRRKFYAAQQRREHLTDSTGIREIFAEADGMPGLIVDRYEGVLVVQVRNQGMERLKPLWLEAMIEVYQPDCIYEKSDMEGRREEALDAFVGVLYGTMPETVYLTEAGLKFEVPVVDGLKTGFYLDQRDGRRRLAERIKPGDKLLDGFCYSGAFSLYAQRAGAETLGVDYSETAIATAKRNAALNGLQPNFEVGNMFEWLEAQKPEPTYDWILLDPPAIAKKSDKRTALKWAVWKLVYNAIPILKPGGRLLVCSCSYQLGLHELLDTIRLATADRGKVAMLEEIGIQSSDHPYSLAFPESWYLKSAWVRIDESITSQPTKPPAVADEPVELVSE